MNRLEKELLKYEAFQHEQRRNSKFNLLEESIVSAIAYLRKNNIPDYCSLVIDAKLISIQYFESKSFIHSIPLVEVYSQEEIKFYLESIERLPSISQRIMVDLEKNTIILRRN